MGGRERPVWAETAHAGYGGFFPTSTSLQLAENRVQRLEQPGQLRGALVPWRPPPPRVMHEGVSPLLYCCMLSQRLTSPQQWAHPKLILKKFPHSLIPQPPGCSLAPVSCPKPFGEKHSRSGRLLPVLTRKSRILILFALHVLGAGAQRTSAVMLQIIKYLQPTPGLLHNGPWEPSMLTSLCELKFSRQPLRKSKHSQHPPTNIQQDGLQALKKMLNISTISYALYRNMICPACFAIPGSITFSLIQMEN